MGPRKEENSKKTKMEAGRTLQGTDGSGTGDAEIPAVCSMVRYGQLGYTESMSIALPSAPTGAAVTVHLHAD